MNQQTRPHFTGPTYPPSPRPQTGPHRGPDLGIAVLLAVTAVAADSMTGALELASLGSLFVVSLFVAAALFPIGVVIQRYAYGDNWPLAIAKAGAISLLTAIPSPLPSVITVALGVAGYGNMKSRAARDHNTIDMDN